MPQDTPPSAGAGLLYSFSQFSVAANRSTNLTSEVEDVTAAPSQYIVLQFAATLIVTDVKVSEMQALYHSLHGTTLAGGAGVQRVRGAQRGRRGHQAHDGGDDDEEDYDDDNDGNYGDDDDHAGPPQQRHEHLQLPQQGRMGPLHHGGQV